MCKTLVSAAVTAATPHAPFHLHGATMHDMLVQGVAAACTIVLRPAMLRMPAAHGADHAHFYLFIIYLHTPALPRCHVPAPAESCTAIYRLAARLVVLVHSGIL